MSNENFDKEYIDDLEDFENEVLDEKENGTTKQSFIQRISRSEFGKAVITKRIALLLGVLICLAIVLFIIRTSISNEAFTETISFLLEFTEKDFLIFVLIGFTAQMIDGALGMAYGASSMTMLTSVGITSSIANSCVKFSEVFTTSASGFSHWKLGNINKKLVKNLIVPGVIGAFFGSILIGYVDSVENVGKQYVKPIISVYILFLGVYILYKALRKTRPKTKTKRLSLLATFGGFADAACGGGWGPIVTSTLLSSGRNPKYTIGSVNLSEFFIAFTSAVVITIIIGVEAWEVGGGLKVVLGLIAGGIVAAPFGAMVAGKVKAKPLMIVVGILIIVVNSWSIYKAWLK